MTKVLVGICQLLTEEDPREASLNACVNSKGERVDTFTNEEKSLFLKTLTTESYPGMNGGDSGRCTVEVATKKDE